MFRLRPGPVILCADDYGMAEGVSRGILELAEAGRISALSAMTTFPRWAADAKKLAQVRGKVAVGLHLNFTLGAPLGAMPRLAPEGRLPTPAALMRKFAKREVDAGEIRDEVLRQLLAFERETGFRPDHIDGHQHVHALPLVRRGVLTALSDAFPNPAKPLIRDPGDRAFSIAGRGGEMAKAFAVAGLTYGFAYLARRRGFPVNRGFSGYSGFDTERLFDIEIAAAMRLTGAGHIVMCHPGYPDAELSALDPVVERREQELETLRTNLELPYRLWRPARDPATGAIDWRALVG